VDAGVLCDKAAVFRDRIKDKACSVFGIIVFVRPSYNKASLHRCLSDYSFSLSASIHPHIVSCGSSKKPLRVLSRFTSCHDGRILVSQY
jgi:hypothetical protein